MERQGCTDVVARRQLADRRGKLRGVGHNSDPPQQEYWQQGSQGRAEEESHQNRTAARHNHCRTGHERAAPAIGVLPSEPTAGGAAAHDCERHQRSDTGDIGLRSAARVLARRHERRDPRPHRIQLPHVTQIADVRKQGSRVF